MPTFYVNSVQKAYSRDNITWHQTNTPQIDWNATTVIFRPKNGDGDITITTATDPVVLDGTTKAPGFYTPLTLVTALQAVFPKANTGTGGTGTGATGPQGPQGVGVSTAAVNGSGHLIITKTDTSTVDAGVVVGATGPQGPAGADGAVVNAALTPTAVKTSAYTAVANDFVKVDASGGTVPITLPTTPADKTRIGVKLIAVSGTNTATITRGGTDVFNKTGGSTAISLSLLNQALIFQYEAATGIWNVTSGDIPLSGLDARFGTLAQQTADVAAIAAINTRLQTETQTYLANIIAAGGTIDAATIHAVDRLVAKWKLLTSWTKVTFISPMMGETLAAALVNLKFPTGLGTLTNNNFVAADYTLNKGFYITANTNKYLQTGFIPTANGATLTSFSMGCFITDNKDLTNDIIGNNPATGSNVFVKNNSQLGVSNIVSASGAGLGSFSISCNGTVLKAALSGIGSIDGAATNTIPLDTEFSYYGHLFNGSRIYGTGGLGFVWFGTAMTTPELQDINLLIEELMRTIGRMPVAPQFCFFGDSITDGRGLNGVTKVKDRFSHQASIMLGVNEFNLGCPTSEFRQTSAAAIAGNLRIQSFANMSTISTIVMEYGTNDQLIGDAASTATASSTIYNDLNNKMKVRIQERQDAGQKVIILSPLWNGTSAAAKQLSYLISMADVAKTQKCIMIDGYNMLLDATYPANPTAADYFTADLIHPTAAGHLLIAQYLVEAARGRIVRRPTLDFPSIAAGATATLTVTMYGTVAGMSVEVTPPPALEAGLVALPPVISANDTVSITLYNSTGSAIDPASAKYYVAVKPNY